MHEHAILIQKSICPDSIISNSNSTVSLRRLFNTIGQEPTLLRDLAPAIRPATFSEPGRLTSEALLGLFGDRVLLLRKNVGDSRDRPPALALNTERAGRKLHAADILK